MQRTLCIIKPDAVEKNLQGKIIKIILDAGFQILNLKPVRLTRKQAEKFYEIHKDKMFYSELVEFMTSGSCIPIALVKENAVNDFRELIGATNPAEAKEGTIRKLYADDKQRNAVHGSDSVENGIKEVNFFFPEIELTM
ncbi:MAG: nucleoside-diphosphate kinase [Ignavibacteria bacterium]|nr:nucleoside-diphosphate kinase [Ignavibacteria bacterium]